jgi:hypothetical protein
MRWIIRRQRQQAGSGAQQFAVAGDLVVVVSEHAAEIAQVQKLRAMQEFTAEAEATAQPRIDDLDDRVINELDQRGLLQAFADPAFQILLRKAQLHAAATEADADHDLLSKLLAERAQEPSKPMHMVVTRAVEVVEQIDDRALAGMTLMWFVGCVVPNAFDPASGLSYLDSLASRFAVRELPTGRGWLERLDLMGCIHYRPPGLQSVKKWHQIFMIARPGYVCEGVPADAEPEIRSRLNDIHPRVADWLVPHLFLPGNFRINTSKMDANLEMFAVQIAEIGKLDELKAVLTECRIDTPSPVAASNMLIYIKENLPNLEHVRQWWDELQGSIIITPVGVAIGYSNAKRYDPLEGFGSLSSMLAAG